MAGKAPNQLSSKRFLHKLNYKPFNDLPNTTTFIEQSLQH